MENNAKYSILSDSVIGKNDESTSMYYSFNSTGIDNEDKTLEGEELTINANNSDNHNSTSDDISIISTVKKSSDPSIRAIFKSKLIDSKIHSSTPTKYFSPRTLSKDEDGSLSIFPVPVKYVKLSENKENINNIKESSPCSNLISEINHQKMKISNGNEKSLHMQKELVFSDDNMLKKNSQIPLTKQLKSTELSAARKKNVLNQPDLFKNRPSRISDKKPSVVASELKNMETKKPDQTIYSEKLTNSMESLKLKREKRRTIYEDYTFPVRKAKINRKSITSEETNSIKRQPRYSVSKTTLNSPGILKKNIRRTIYKPLIKNDDRKNSGQNNFLSNSPKTLISTINDNKKLKSTIVDNKHGTSFSAATLLKEKPETKIWPIICLQCPKEFRVQSIYESHKISHQLNINNENKCKFCDKKFAKPKVLHTHLLENCLKISSLARKKLLTEQSANTRKSMSTLKVPTLKINSHKPVSTLTSSSMSSNESVSSNSGIQPDVESMPPPTSTIVKKKMPHSGIRTPTKLLICQLCKTSFNNVYDYTDHTLSHSQKANN